jgi:ABC-type transport system substrate-binding protein
MTDNTSVSRRRFLQATGGAASAAAISGCIGGGDGSGSDNEKQDKSFKRINSTMSTLDPVKATDTASGVVIQQLFDGLMNYPNGEIAVEKQLAKEYTVSDDGKTYTFTLKDDAKFHNGDEVTAKDFVYSWERLAGSPNSRRAYFLLSSIGIKHETATVTQEGENGETQEVSKYKPKSLAISAEDEKTFKVELKSPFHSTLEMAAYTSLAAVPQGSVGDIPGWDGDAPKYYSADNADSKKHKKFAKSNPIGAGPFKFDSWKTKSSAKVVRNEEYHGSTAIVKAVEWTILSDGDARYSHSMEKKSDMISMPTSKYDPNKVNVETTDSKNRKVGTYGDLQNGLTADYLAVPTINSFYIGMNAENVKEPARKAVAYAMNQQEVVNNIFKGRGEPAYHFTPPGIFPGGAKNYEKSAKENWPYGYNKSMLDKAKSVMEDAGYSKDNKYEFTFTYYASSTTWGDLGKQLQSKLKSAHINMNIEKAPFSTLLNRGRKGNLEAYSLGWIMDWPAPDNFLQNAYPPLTDTSDGAQGLYVDWENTSASEAATEAWEKIEANPAATKEARQKRQEAYLTMESALRTDMVLLPCYHRVDERFLYEWVDWPKFGFAGTSRAMCNNVKIGDRK